MNKSGGRLFPVLLVAALVYSPVIFAQQNGPGGGPPPEAFKACKGKAAGTKVEFKNRRGVTVKATCRMLAVPERMERRVKGGDAGQQGGPGQ